MGSSHPIKIALSAECPLYHIMRDLVGRFLGPHDLAGRGRKTITRLSAQFGEGTAAYRPTAHGNGTTPRVVPESTLTATSAG